MTKTMAFAIAALAAACANSAEPSSSAIGGFFGQLLGQPLAGKPERVFRGSPQEPGIHYVMRVPDSFPIKDFKNFIAFVDTESGMVGGVYAELLMSDTATCLEKRRTIDAFMSQQFKGATEKQTASYRHGARSASVTCGGPKTITGTILSVRIDDFEFNRQQEDKYIRAVLKVNAE
jgi:hypothetical protein